MGDPHWNIGLVMGRQLYHKSAISFKCWFTDHITWSRWSDMCASLQCSNGMRSRAEDRFNCRKGTSFSLVQTSSGFNRHLSSFWMISLCASCAVLLSVAFWHSRETTPNLNERYRFVLCVELAPSYCFSNISSLSELLRLYVEFRASKRDGDSGLLIYWTVLRSCIVGDVRFSLYEYVGFGISVHSCEVTSCCMFTSDVISDRHSLLECCVS